MIKSNILDTIIQYNLQNELFKGSFGIEKENLRVNSDGHLALTPHPKVFGDKMENPFITVDFSESQLEMITPPLKSITEVYSFLEKLHNTISINLDNEYLWPQSVPPIIPDEEKIPIAIFQHSQDGKRAEKYREMLSKTYGRSRQLLSGIHYNFSFDISFLKELHKLIAPNEDFKNFKDEVYLKISRNYIRNRWLIIYLLGASSLVHKSFFHQCPGYKTKCVDGMKVKDNTFYSNKTTSFRHGRCGYRNKDEFYVSFNSIDEYISDIKNHVSKETIHEVREFYSPVRIKTKDTVNILNSLKNDGIQYIEIRTVDLNPYSPIGVDVEDLHFIHLLLLYCLFDDNDPLECLENHNSNQNHDNVAINGKSKYLRLYRKEDDGVLLKNWANEILNNIGSFVHSLGIETDLYTKVLDFQKNKIDHEEQMYSTKLVEDLLDSSFVDLHINKAVNYLTKSENSKNFFSLNDSNGELV